MGQTAHPRSPDAYALLERYTEGEYICCVQQAESCLMWAALMRAHELEYFAHM